MFENLSTIGICDIGFSTKLFLCGQDLDNFRLVRLDLVPWHSLFEVTNDPSGLRDLSTSYQNLIVKGPNSQLARMGKDNFSSVVL